MAADKSKVDDAGIGPEEDWRVSVQQSYRNAEVREIAKVLASLEPGTKESSKLRLAMQFEDSVFKSATSLADYRKTITKRLKKVQKSYKPPEQNEAKDTANKERELQELRKQYGESLKYIMKYSETAYNEMKDKHGEEKAAQLKQHTDGVQIWAADLGLLSDGNNKPNLSMSHDQLNKLKEHLERRLENIRCHVVKLADPDQFMAENLEKAEKEFKDKASAVSILAEYSRKRYELWQKTTVDPEKLLLESLEQANRSVPPPTRIQRNDERAALIHLDKMRAASTAFFAYMATKDKDKVPRNTLLKAHNVAREGIEFVQRVMHEHRKQQTNEEITLQDAWMKPLILPPPAADDGLDNAIPPLSKRFKISHKNPVLRSRVLLTKNRKTPTNLLMALRRKRASLIRPPPVGEGSYLVLEFGKVFVMYIYVVPLLVTIRAYKQEEDDGSDYLQHVGSSSTSISEWQCASWIPLHNGLTENKEFTACGVKGTYETLGTVVEEHLRDASAHATHTLRKCFAKHVKEDSKQDFETEIYEASALLEFLHLARTTYLPSWEDDDIV